LNANLARICQWSVFGTADLLLATLAAIAQGAAESPKGERTNAADAAGRKAKAEADIDGKYQALVAQLPPDQQAWERVWQDQPGRFDLPLHQRAKVAGQSTAWNSVSRWNENKVHEGELA
jgi:hypothetical protein